MNPLNDHELLLRAMRAGLTRDEVRQAVRKGLDAGRIPRQRADEMDSLQPDCLNLEIEAIQVVAGLGGTVGVVRVANGVGRGVSGM